MNQVRTLREKRGLKQYELANLLGVSKGKMSKIESGVQALTEEQIRTLARIFEVHPGAILEPIDIETVVKQLGPDTRKVILAILKGMDAA